MTGTPGAARLALTLALPLLAAALFATLRPQAGPGAGLPIYEAARLEYAYPTGGGLGVSLARSGSLLAAGAIYDSAYGAVHLYEEIGGCSVGWEPLLRLYPFDTDTADDFGSALDLEGETLVVGDHTNDAAGWLAGAVNIYERNLGGPDNWGLRKQLTIASGGSTAYFGRPLDLAGDTLAVGAPSFNSTGEVFIFERDLGGPDNWGLRTQFTAADAQNGWSFGVALALDGDRLAVGAYGADDDDGTVYVYERDAGGADNWGQTQKLIPSEASEGGFGTAVSLDGATLAVGEPDYPFKGTVYVYTHDGSTWSEATHFSAGDGTGQDRFGQFLDLHGDLLLVSATHGFSGAGEAYLYARDEGGPDAWGEVAHFQPEGVEGGDSYGAAVLLDDGLGLVGAYREDLPSGPNRGAIYAYRPLAAHDDSGPEYATVNDIPFTTGNVLDNDQGEGLSFLCVDTSGLMGTLVDHGDGTFDYDPPFDLGLPAGTVITDTFRYTLSDASGAVDSAEVAIAIEVDGLKAYLPTVRSCGSLYYDDFSDPNSGWPEVDTGSTLYEYLNGEYRIRLDNPFWLAGATPGVSFTKYIASVDVRNVQNLPGSYGLVLALSPDWSAFVTVEITKDRGYEIWRYMGSWNLLDSGTSTAIKPGALKNTISVERFYNFGSSNYFKVWVNGEFVDLASESNLTGALRAGVWVTGGPEDGLDIRFDNFTVVPLGCGSDLEGPLAGPGLLAPPLAVPAGPAWLERAPLDLPPRGE